MAFTHLNAGYDDGPEADGPEEAVSTAAVDVPSAPPRPRRTFASLSSGQTADDETEDFGPDAPEPAEGAADDEVRDEFAALGDLVAAQPAPDIGDPAPSAGESPSVTREDEKEQPEEADPQIEEAIRKLAEENGLSIDEAREQVMVQRQALIDEAARQTGMSPEEAEKALRDQNARAQMARAAAGGGGGGGAVAALVGGISSMFKGGANVSKRAYNATIADRIYRHRYDAFQSGIEDMRTAGKDLKSRMEEFNAAFLGSEAASRLRQMAKAEGREFDDYLSDLNSGKVDSPEARAAMNEAMAEPEVAAAWSQVSESGQKLSMATGTAERNMEKLATGHSDRFNTDAETSKFRKAGEESLEGVDPALKNDETKKFMKHLEEMMENIRRIVERVIERVAGLFRR